MLASTLTSIRRAVQSVFQPIPAYKLRQMLESLERRTLLTQVVSTSFQHDTLPYQLIITFDRNVSASVAPSDLQLTNVTYDQPVTGLSVSAALNGSGNTVATFAIPSNANFSFGDSPAAGMLPSGNYELRIAADAVDTVHSPQAQPSHLPADYVNTNVFCLTGDLNHDRTVDQLDLNLVSQNYNHTSATLSTGDANGDTVVNAADVTVVTDAYGTALTVLADAPGEISTLTDSESVQLQWLDDQTNEAGWRVMRSLDGISWTNPVHVDPDTTTYTVNGLVDGTNYRFRVRAFDPDTAYSHTAAITTLPAPDAPTVASVTDGSATIDLIPNSTTQSYYTINWRPLGSEEWTGSDTVDATESTYTATGLDEGADYEFAVSVANNVAESAAGETSVVTTAPHAPDNVNLDYSGASTGTVTWDDQSETEDGYEITISLDGGETWTVAGRVGTGVTTFSLVNLPPLFIPQIGVTSIKIPTSITQIPHGAGENVNIKSPVGVGGGTTDTTYVFAVSGGGIAYEMFSEYPEYDAVVTFSLALTQVPYATAPFDIPLNYRVISGDWTAQSDDFTNLTLGGGTITILKDSSSARLYISAADDTIAEWTEDVYFVLDTMSLTVSNATPTSSRPTGSSSYAQVSIVSDEIDISNLPPVMKVNDDDDNKDGIEDKSTVADTSVDEEDDLYRVDLTVPQDLKEGAHVTLSAPSTRVAVWQYADRTGIKYIDTNTSYTWTYHANSLESLPPASVWVEAVTGSIVPDVQLTLSALDNIFDPYDQQANSDVADQTNVAKNKVRPKVWVADPQDGSEDGPINGSFYVVRDGDLSEPLTAKLGFQNAGRSPDHQDWVYPDASVFFPAQISSVRVSVPVYDDPYPEATLDMLVAHVAPSPNQAYNVVGDPIQLYIHDNDLPPGARQKIPHRNDDAGWTDDAGGGDGDFGELGGGGNYDPPPGSGTIDEPEVQAWVDLSVAGVGYDWRYWYAPEYNYQYINNPPDKKWYGATGLPQDQRDGLTQGGILRLNSDFDESLDYRIDGTPPSDLEKLGITSSDNELSSLWLGLWTDNETQDGDWSIEWDEDKVKVWSAVFDDNGHFVEYEEQESGWEGRLSDLEYYHDYWWWGYGLSAIVEPIVESTAIDDTTFTATFTADDANTVTDKIKATIVDTDIDVDADNDNGFAAPDRSAREEWLEANAGEIGKPVVINNDDSDGDGIPGWADGFSLNTGQDYRESLQDEFVPVVIQLPAAAIPAETKINISYSASDPLHVNLDTYSAAGGMLRLWTKDASLTRNGLDIHSGGDFVSPGSHTWADFSGGSQIVLWAEGIRPSQNLGDCSIRIDIVFNSPIGERTVANDSVQLTIIPQASIRFLEPDIYEDSGSGSVNGKFRLSRSGLLSEEMIVSIEQLGTASPGIDYEEVPSTITIPAGDAYVDVIVKVINDHVFEDEFEDVTLHILPNSVDGPRGLYTLAPPTTGPQVESPSIATAVIADQPPKPLLSEVQQLIFPELWTLYDQQGAAQYYSWTGSQAFHNAYVTYNNQETFTADLVSRSNAGGWQLDHDVENDALAKLAAGQPVSMFLVDINPDAAATAFISQLIAAREAEANSVGEPTPWESLIPVWGNSRAAVHDFQTGHWGWGIFHGGLAVTDVFLVKSLVTAGTRSLFKAAIAPAEQAARAATADLVAQRLSAMVSGDVEMLREAEAAISLATDASRALHKAAAWSRYQARANTKLTEAQWSALFDQNLDRARKAAKAVDNYHAILGWGEREVTVEAGASKLVRRLDIADTAAQKGIEYKTGYQCASANNLWELARDVMLKREGWEIKWVFEGEASAPLKAALDAAGIPYLFR